MRVLILLVCSTAVVHAAELLDLSPFARPCCSADEHHVQTLFDYRHPAGVVRRPDGKWAYGLQWAEERDIFELRVRFRSHPGVEGAAVEYWFLNWPYDPPKMPTIEDPMDDPWQGSWIKARTESFCEGQDCRFRFQPLTGKENPRARNLPGVLYRRTVRFRLLFPAGDKPDIEPVQVFSESTVRRMEVRVQVDDPSPRFRAYNGTVRDVKHVSGGFLLSLDVADPQPAGSNDVTIIEVRNGSKSFAFAPSDVEKEPVYIPDFHAYITLASDRRPFSDSLVKHGARIRERLAAETEQTFDRASREIPALDPVERQGERLYLPLAADASWQKFAFEWGGNVHISKDGTKAMGRERRRLGWPGDRIGWRIGTGESRNFRPESKDSTLSLLEGRLPVALARWTEGPLDYEEEALATLLSGPLSPEDPARSEQTPAVLLIEMRIRNRSSSRQQAHLWIGMEPAERLAFEGDLLIGGDGRFVRAALHLPGGADAKIRDGFLHIQAAVSASGGLALRLALPFIPDLTDAERDQLRRLDYQKERGRVTAYWRGLTEQTVPFRVLESRFHTFAEGLLARIRISATKDPKSGLYMVPAASYFYKVYANEASFQAQLLDVLGDHELSEKYMHTLVSLQGSKPFDGSYTGGQKEVYHGARVDPDYDYTASQYNLDHGTVLWTLGLHYLYTRDREWFREVAPSMKRAADWIVRQRRLTQVMVDGERCPEYGLLPGGHLEDNHDWGHWFSVNAYASAGMRVLAQALEDTGDPQATEYRKEADLYREDLRAAVESAAAAAPVIRLRDHTYVPYVPTRVHQRIRLFGPLRVAYYSRYPEKVLPTYRLSATRELLYGPLILFDTGIFKPGEAMAGWLLDDWEDNATMSSTLGLHVHGWVDEQYWFSRGGMVFQANLQNPVRLYVRRDEIPAAIRGLYNAFVACYYPTVNLFTEEFRQWRSPSGPFYKIPDEAKFVHRLRELLVFEDNDELHLAAGTPRRWLNPGEKIEVRNAPTWFGPVSYLLEASEDSVRGFVELPNRNTYRNAWITIRLPEGRQITSVSIDDKPWTEVDQQSGKIHLPRTGRRLGLVVRSRQAGK